MNYLTSQAIFIRRYPVIAFCCLSLWLLTACNQTSPSDIKPDNALIVDLGDDFSISTGETVELAMQVNQQDMRIVTYQWIQTSGNPISLTEDNNSYLAFTASKDDALEFKLIVTDSEGLEYTDSVIITVLPVDEGEQYTAQLSWTAPTENEDGSSLTNLTGYKIYYGKSITNLDTLILVNDPLQTSYYINNLDAGLSYFFCITAYNGFGQESQCSDIADIIL